MTFYGPGANVIAQGECNLVTGVAWRDDRGQAHTVTVDIHQKFGVIGNCD